ncbi:protein serine/threonine phosphatase 2C [Fragilariopsis cylindrus CCMP1102]|uniref:protein-serine/threonine phosphatase n=1 Tax=Fragilariopsis cylindrus CCMP1102 TaxID=635003 RepID=A0A1E7FIQ7_9STRA|nr:protein serine/threonine phosphatase 2C [Fragilariopsis cylindrus CCMP1102]|eukprot:OEU17935.1 protein serine/threonine phosphatase 2C [Fragilariopsis cylindrus CCMP1102]
MGTYLSTPITEKCDESGESLELEWGVVDMQGWRKSMEDSHTAQGEQQLQQMARVFGVYDGHGGAEVARFCQYYFVDVLMNQPINASQTPVGKSLREAFHAMDRLIDDPTRQHEISILRSTKTMKAQADKSLSTVLTPEQAEVLKHEIEEFEKKTNSNNNADKEEDGEKDDDNHPIHAGATAVVAVITGKILTVANAGDSRAVLCRRRRSRDGNNGTDDDGHYAFPLSYDHKPSQTHELNRILCSGGFVNHFGRINGNLNLSRSIGDLKYKQVPGIPPEDQMITAEPDIMQIVVEDEDEFIILGCDGIWDCLSNEQAVNFVMERIQTKTPVEIGTEMLDTIISDDPRITQGIGGDNMTIMIIDLQTSNRERRRKSNTSTDESLSSTKENEDDDNNMTTTSEAAME